MRYRYYYKKYEHSKLATFISALQGSFWGAVFFGMLPALPIMIIGINQDIPALIGVYVIVLIITTVLIMRINTDKLAERAYNKKNNRKW